MDDSKVPVVAKLGISKVVLGTFRADPQEVFDSLQQRKDVTVKRLDGGGVEIILKPQPWTIWIIVGVGLIISGLLLMMGVAEQQEWFDTPIHYEPAQFYMYGSLGLAGCFTAALVRLAWGKPKPTIFAVYPGQLEIDFYTAGDHIVRKYHADDIKDIHVGGGLQIVLRNNALDHCAIRE